jgi:hypothetical protein
MGPAGPEAADGDRRLRDRWIAGVGPNPSLVWLDDQSALALATVAELFSYMNSDRVAAVRVRGVFRLWSWWTMHRAAIGDSPLKYRTDCLHAFFWARFAAAARRSRRVPFYRYVVVGDLR